jgi:hypothetical protein
MSSGLVICNNCRREVHQDGDPNQAYGWRHCNDKTPACGFADGAALGSNFIRYPTSTSEIVGPYCGRDVDPSEREEQGGTRAERRRRGWKGGNKP